MDDVFVNKANVTATALTDLAKMIDPSITSCTYDVQRRRTSRKANAEERIDEYVTIRYKKGSKLRVNVSGCSTGAMSISVLEKIIY